MTGLNLLIKWSELNF